MSLNHWSIIPYYRKKIKLFPLIASTLVDLSSFWPLVLGLGVCVFIWDIFLVSASEHNLSLSLCVCVSVSNLFWCEHTNTTTLFDTMTSVCLSHFYSRDLKWPTSVILQASDRTAAWTGNDYGLVCVNYLGLPGADLGSVLSFFYFF